MTRRGTAREISNSHASARELTVRWFGGDEDERDAGVGEEDAWEVRSARCRAGEDIDATLSEGVVWL